MPMECLLVTKLSSLNKDFQKQLDYERNVMKEFIPLNSWQVCVYGMILGMFTYF